MANGRVIEHGWPSLFGVVFGLAVSAGASAEVGLVSTTGHPAGTRPGAVTVADLDADGNLDLAVANAGSGDLSVLLGSGGGAFQDAVAYPVGGNPVDVVEGDLDGDGDVDLALANGRSGGAPGGVAVLLGNGDGTFADATLLAAGEDPAALVAADLDGDGNLDLAAANAASGDVSVLIGAGDGTFRDAARVPAGPFPRSLIAADLDGDGSLDLVTANSGLGEVGGANIDVAVVVGSVTLMPGNGDGTFREAVDVGAGSQPLDVVAADVDGDGDLDLAAINTLFDDVRGGSDPAATGSAHVAVLLGNGDGTFSAAARSTAGRDPRSLVALDADGDGKIDLATADAAGEVSVFTGNGDGTFETGMAYVAGVGTVSLASADVDGDGNVDLASANQGSGDVSVLLGRGDGSLRATAAYEPGSQPHSIVTADLDGDGNPDLATANYGGAGDVGVLLGDGEGTLEAAGSFAAGFGALAVVAADLDGDGTVDLATANADFSDSEADVSVLLGDGDGTFRGGSSHAAGRGSLSLVAADLDGDDRTDLAVANYGTRDVSVLLGTGGGMFADAVSYGVGLSGRSLLAADLDGDGNIDLALANADFGVDPAEVSVLLGNGDGTFEPATRHAAGRGSLSLIATDLDGDGVIDLAAASYDSGEVVVRRGNGDGSFAETVAFTAGANPRALIAADLDGDGRLDLATANSSSGSVSGDVSVLRGNGDGTFQGALRFAAGRLPRDLVAVDLDGDDRLDLAVANLRGVAVLLNEPAEPLNANQNAAGITFHRGDPNSSGTIDISDGVGLFAFLFLGGSAPPCMESADFQNDGEVNVSDGISLLNFLFLDGPPPAKPGPPASPCGPDVDPRESSGSLGCEDYDRCG